nr:MAG TPA: hypothetical protein [Caudoviricetes sp.]
MEEIPFLKSSIKYKLIVHLLCFLKWLTCPVDVVINTISPSYQ